MARIITVINHKGGVGKTTTAHVLQELGERVLFIDLDPQGSLSSCVSIPSGNPLTIYDVVTQKASIKDAIQHGTGFDIITSSERLTGADTYLTGSGTESILKTALKAVQRDYDYIIIDTPPSLNILTINALVATDYVLIPAGADAFSIHGIGQLMQTIDAVQKTANKKLKVLGIVITRHNNRAVLYRDTLNFLNQIAPSLNAKIYKSTIRDSVIVKEAQIKQKNTIEYSPKSKVAGDYRAFLGEILADIKGDTNNG